ncbi:MAG TPA: hypothetical protein VMG12_38980 [Polyangiaceae bacterium]|nr:hypothetical protein [Polyangiaceae bacterium]
MMHFARAMASALVGRGAGVGLVAGLALAGCGNGELDEGLPFVTIDECEEMGGTPLFDPDDERPATMSCPDGLETIAELDEDFYGTEGGICCTSSGAASDTAAVGDGDSHETAR